MIGHVSDGKSTLVKALTGQTTQRFSQEKQNNLTIKLGYANCKIIKCNTCLEPDCFGSVASNVMIYKCNKCNSDCDLVNHISFVDCPGHHSFMQTMLSGTSVMDYTILVESLGNKQIPAPQTIKHLNSIEFTQIENCMVILNKIDLVNKEKCRDAISDMKNFISNYKAKSNPIIPISASLNINIDIICSILATLKPKPVNTDRFRMNIIRSFNINKPGTNIDDLQGGVIGGSIQSGYIELENDVYIYPGIVYEDIKKFKPIKTKILSINSDSNKLKKASSGGLIGIQLDIDPGLTGNDKLVGNQLIKNSLGFVTNSIIIDTIISDSTDNLFISISSQTIKVNSNDGYRLNLESPIYVEFDDYITLFTRDNDNINFIGISRIKDVIKFTLSE
jgi:translation initiation factor 2 subunit 3